MSKGKRVATSVFAGLIFPLLLLAAPAAAHELVAGGSLEGFPFSSPASVAISADGRDLYAAGASPGGNYWNGPVAGTPGLVWLRRDAQSGKLEFQRNYLSRGGDPAIFGAVLDRAGEHLYVLTATEVLAAQRGGDGALHLAAAAALPAGFEPQRISLLPDGRLYVGGARMGAIFDRPGDGIALRASFAGDPAPSPSVSVLADDLFVSGYAAFRLTGGEWIRGALNTVVPNDFEQPGRPIDISPDGRYLYQVSFHGESPGFTYVYATHEKVSPGYYAQLGSSWLGISTFHRDLTATLLHPSSGHLYVASIDRATGGDSRIDHFRPIDGGRDFLLADSIADPGQELAGRTRKTSLALSPDGGDLYATFGGEPLALFEIDPQSGALTFVPRAAGAASRFERPFKSVPAASGDDVYVLTPNAVLQVGHQDGQLSLRSSLELDPWTAALSPREVRDLVLAPGGGLGVLASASDLCLVSRNPATGRLELQTATSVRPGQPIGELELSPDGRFVYAVAWSGTFVYELRAPLELALVQYFPQSGSALRLSPNGTDALFVKSGGTPYFLSRSPQLGTLSPAGFDSQQGPFPFDVRDALFGGDGSLLYFFHRATGEPGPPGRVEVLAKEPAGWRTVADNALPFPPVGRQLLSPGGRDLYQLDDSGLALASLLPASRDFELAPTGGLDPEALDSVGTPFAGGDFGRQLEPLSLLPGGDPLLVANPASGNLQLFHPDCGWGGPDPCLVDQRFEVTVDWRDAEGVPHRAAVEPAGSDNTKIFTFFDPSNWELMVKVLDGCGLNDRFWVFAAASTDVAFDIRVRDSFTGATKLYSSPAGEPAPAITDVHAFATCGAPPPDRHPVPVVFPPLVASPTLKLASQFTIKVRWTDHQGQQGQATGLVKPGGFNNSGIFYFFDRDNWEMQVKVLAGCHLNGSFWLLASATTDVGYELEIFDPVSNRTKTYRNPVGRASPAIIDLFAFSCDGNAPP